MCQTCLSIVACSADRLMRGTGPWRARINGVKFISEVGSPSLRNYQTQPSFLADRDCLLCTQPQTSPQALRETAGAEPPSVSRLANRLIKSTSAEAALCHTRAALLAFGGSSQSPS